MSREEVSSLSRALAKLEDEARILLLPRDPLDDKNVLLEVRSGFSHTEIRAPESQVEQCAQTLTALKTELDPGSCCCPRTPSTTS